MKKSRQPASKLTPSIVKKARKAFMLGMKVCRIHENFGSTMSRKNFSLMLHNHLYKDASYGVWLRRNVVTRYTRSSK